MDPLSAIMAGIQGGTGIIQLLSGLFGQQERPKYDIPTAATESLNVAKGLAGQTKLPGQDIYETQLGEKTANMTKNIEKMGGGGSGLGTLSNIYAQEAGAKRNLAVDAAKYYQQNQRGLQGALGQYAGWQDKKWQYDVGQPAADKDAATSASIQAGMSNAFAAGNNIAGMNFYDNLFNPKKQNSTSTPKTQILQSYANPLGSPKSNAISNSATATSGGLFTPEMLQILMGQLRQV